MIFTRLFVTYFKTNYINGKKYVGHASMLVDEVNEESALKTIKRRDSGHHRNKDEYSPAEFDRMSIDKEAIYGREQQVYDALVEQGICGNKIRPVSKRNKKLKRYMAAAAAAFGDITLALITWHFFVNPLF